jgi:hypothetical protein
VTVITPIDLMRRYSSTMLITPTAAAIASWGAPAVALCQM